MSMTIDVGSTFYRYEVLKTTGMWPCDGPFSVPIIKVYCDEFIVERLTPKGCWIHQKDFPFAMEKKWIANNGFKKYAYPSKQAALENFKFRWELRAKYLEQSAKITEAVLGKVRRIEQ